MTGSKRKTNTSIVLPAGREDPGELGEWLIGSQAGEEESRLRMYAWVHRCALNYYLSKTVIEPLLSYHDAQDLASDCLIEFERSWREVRSLPHYTRRMLKNNLQRFLKRKRRVLQRERTLGSDEMELQAYEAIRYTPVFEFERLSDEDERRYRSAVCALRQADPIVQDLFKYRVFSETMTYREIAEHLGASETSLRMRMARFNKRVRTNHARQESRRRQTEGVSPVV